MNPRLATKTPFKGWQWVMRRHAQTKSVVTTPVKEAALWPQDLHYFMEAFPSNDFRVTEELPND